MFSLRNLTRIAVLFVIFFAFMSSTTLHNSPASKTSQDVSYSFKGSTSTTLSLSAATNKNNSSKTKEKKTIISPDTIPVSATFHKTNTTVNIKSVGLDKKGRMGTVEDPKTLSWYNTKGHKVQNLLLSSHRDWNGELGILHGLESWETNQQLTLTFQDGKQKPYRLADVKVYHKDKVPKDVMQLQQGNPRVTVITCTGDFHPNDGGYDKRAIAIFEPMY
ncbi:class F sortase [Pontibacillus sp. HMF3514]|uniref:class F sortase n=1 Tax=Pontibacillus sp. HMF3514 TaxID=2692425 RepID=UPI00131F7375|nr:class F sortase [Pontibacillus sp. HMF3514]QHE51309.1 sortase [Pontibacillus sp. HMF3514]